MPTTREGTEGPAALETREPSERSNGSAENGRGGREVDDRPQWQKEADEVLERRFGGSFRSNQEAEGNGHREAEVERVAGELSTRVESDVEDNTRRIERLLDEAAEKRFEAENKTALERLKDKTSAKFSDLKRRFKNDMYASTKSKDYFDKKPPEEIPEDILDQMAHEYIEYAGGYEQYKEMGGGDYFEFGDSMLTKKTYYGERVPAKNFEVDLSKNKHLGTEIKVRAEELARQEKVETGEFNVDLEPEEELKGALRLQKKVSDQNRVKAESSRAAIDTLSEENAALQRENEELRKRPEVREEVPAAEEELSEAEMLMEEKKLRAELAETQAKLEESEKKRLALVREQEQFAREQAEEAKTILEKSEESRDTIKSLRNTPKSTAEGGKTPYAEYRDLVEGRTKNPGTATEEAELENEQITELSPEDGTQSENSQEQFPEEVQKIASVMTNNLRETLSMENLPETDKNQKIAEYRTNITKSLMNAGLSAGEAGDIASGIIANAMESA